MSTTPFAYHDDEANHGNYQYVTLKEIINSFLRKQQDDDSILKNTKRSLMLDVARDGISKFYREGMGDYLAIEITVPDSLYFALPHDYVHYIRISLVVYDTNEDSYRLQPLDVNQNINTANGYLQDHEYEILFDEDGYILNADSSNAYNKPHKRYKFNTSYGQPTLDTTQLSKWGECKIDRERGKMVFSSDLQDKEIVFEYLSDGLGAETYNEGLVKVHKNTIDALKAFIYHGCIEYNQNVSQSEKRRALDRFKTEYHNAKKLMAGINLLEISKAMRVTSKNI